MPNPKLPLPIIVVVIIAVVITSLPPSLASQPSNAPSSSKWAPRFLGKFSTTTPKPRPPHRQQQQPKIRYETRYFAQRLDHFSFTDTPKFQQRYLINTEHWVGAQRLGPIFFYCGNEGGIEWFAENTGFVWELAPRFGAMVLFPEHRYYGESMPYGSEEEAYKNASTLSFLTAGQTLADFAVLITELKRNLSAEGCPVVLFGGSYGGMLAAWMRLKYPHIAIGALASSAPILQFEDIVPTETFYNIVSNDFRRESSSCFNTIKASWDALVTEGQKDNGLVQLTKTFRLCRELKKIDDLSDWLDSAYSYLAMVNYPYPAEFVMPLPGHPIKEVCRKIDDCPDGTSTLERVFEGVSIFYNYTGQAECFELEDTSAVGTDGWNWQACTEMVMPMSSRDASMFPCGANRAYLEQADDAHIEISGFQSNDGSSFNYFPPDVIFYVQGRAIEAHRVILSARSPFFRRKFVTDWKHRKEVRFAREKLSYPALYSLIHFFYSDRLEIAVDDMEDVVRICKVCKCESLQGILEKELIHQKYADYKSLSEIDSSKKRFILQGLFLPEEDRLPASLHKILQVSLANSTRQPNLNDGVEELISFAGTMQINDFENDLADVCVRVDKKNFRCHQVVLASRSEYFKARLSRMMDFHEGKDDTPIDTLPCLEEHDLSTEAFEKMIEYMYTDELKDIDPDQAGELFDAAARYLLFPLKRAVADVLLPHLEEAAPGELCHWLQLSDMYDVPKIREFCLDTIACNFEAFAEMSEFRAMLLTLPPPSGDSSLRTTVPSAPGAEVNTDQCNLLDDLREKWLEAEAAELDKRDESALIFDKRLEMLMVVAEREKSDGFANDGIPNGPRTSLYPYATAPMSSEQEHEYVD